MQTISLYRQPLFKTRNSVIHQLENMRAHLLPHSEERRLTTLVQTLMKFYPIKMQQRGIQKMLSIERFTWIMHLQLKIGPTCKGNISCQYSELKISKKLYRLLIAKQETKTFLHLILIEKQGVNQRIYLMDHSFYQANKLILSLSQTSPNNLDYFIS